MANYSALDFSPCIDRLHPEIPDPGQPNPCVPWPSSFNPYKVNHIQDFKMSMLQEIITNRFFGIELNLCYAAASLLPNTFIAITNVTNTPQYLNLPVLDLWRMAQHTMPATINNTITPVDVIAWWWNSTVNDTEATSRFLRAVEDDCRFAICDSFVAIGDPDITGIGVGPYQVLGTGSPQLIGSDRCSYPPPCLSPWPSCSRYRPSSTGRPTRRR